VFEPTRPCNSGARPAVIRQHVEARAWTQVQGSGTPGQTPAWPALDEAGRLVGVVPRSGEQPRADQPPS
jgi:hypothetical protein